MRLTFLASKTQKYELKVSSHPENLAVIREFISRRAQQAGFDEDTTNKIELAVDEACANVVRHAYYSDKKEHPLGVLIQIDTQKFRVTVSDMGCGFDIDAIKPVNLKEYVLEHRTGGLGIHLMRTLMDEVNYDLKPGRLNRVTLVKYFSPAAV
ncbi:ATP-binding protein [bacterium]|nr:ATP-binding protein [bacterium]